MPAAARAGAVVVVDAAAAAEAGNTRRTSTRPSSRRTNHATPTHTLRLITAASIAVAALARPCGDHRVARLPHGPAPAATTAAKPADGAKRGAVYPTAQEAVDALVAALRAGDAKKPRAVLGSGISGCSTPATPGPIAPNGRYVAAYDEKHSLQMDGDAKAILITGAQDWPGPVPVVQRSGRLVLRHRRRGRDRRAAPAATALFTIRSASRSSTCSANTRKADHNGDGVLEYARRFFSSKGKEDGALLADQDGEPPSPGGPRLAEASASRAGSKGPQPYPRLLLPRP